MYVYGGPGTLQGKFEKPSGLSDRQGWIGVDRTQIVPAWHVSTFNAGNLDAVVGNRAMWAGADSSAEPSWAFAPGYGNNRRDWLDWRHSVPNPGQPTSVRLQFTFNFDIEPSADFFRGLWDSAGVMSPIFEVSGNNRDGETFVAVQFDTTFVVDVYSGPQANEVHLRLEFTSGGADSDEDGGVNTDGAVQVDNICVSFNGAPIDGGGDPDAVARFEDGDLEGWMPVAPPFVGDFSKVLSFGSDLDPCQANLTPVMCFIDNGSAPGNAPGQTTGGARSPNWNYGPPGGWVVNYEGGMTLGGSSLQNEVWSPEIWWDDPATAVDDFQAGSGLLRFDVYDHLPVENGIVHYWRIRSFEGNQWSRWSDERGWFSYSAFNPRWRQMREPIRGLIGVNPVKVQVALGAWDVASIYNLPGEDATPSPALDNVSVVKINTGSPAISVLSSALFQGGFPPSGTVDTEGDLRALAVRIDAAQPMNPFGMQPVAGDSLYARIYSSITGAAIAGLPVIHFRLSANPLFDLVREVPAGVTLAGTTAAGWNVFAGTRPGVHVAGDGYAFEIPGDGPGRVGPATFSEPDEDRFFFPGDQIHYFIEAVDTAGETARVPADTSGYCASNGYDERFTVRALPSLQADGVLGTRQPRILVIDESNQPWGELSHLRLALAQNGLVEGRDYDIYRVLDRSNPAGIGSAGRHGATPVQLSGYDILLYLGGSSYFDLLSDGSGVSGDDSDDDIGTLIGWREHPHDRFMVYFGDHIGWALYDAGPVTFNYLHDVMGVELLGFSAASATGNESAPRVSPVPGGPGGFLIDFVSFHGCPYPYAFDWLLPRSGTVAVASHDFVNASGVPYAGSAAGIWYERTAVVGGTPWRRVDVTFPASFSTLYDGGAVDPLGRSARAALLGEMLLSFGHPLGSLPTAAPAAPRRFVLGQNSPNPFNPVTRIGFELPARGRVQLRVLDVRGRAVRTLVEQELEAGQHSVDFDGRDERGVELASGVYIYRVEQSGRVQLRRMVLMR